MQATITRARALIVHQNRLLLMKRIKAGFEYYTLIGGKVEPGETPEQACVREVMEETSVKVAVIREAYRNHDIYNSTENTHIIFTCHYLGGTPVLNGEEKQRCTTENYYEPVWAAKDTLATLTIMPEWQAPYLLTAFEQESTHG